MTTKYRIVKYADGRYEIEQLWKFSQEWFQFGNKNFNTLWGAKKYLRKRIKQKEEEDLKDIKSATVTKIIEV